MAQAAILIHKHVSEAFKKTYLLLLLENSLVGLTD